MLSGRSTITSSSTAHAGPGSRSLPLTPAKGSNARTADAFMRLSGHERAADAAVSHCGSRRSSGVRGAGVHRVSRECSVRVEPCGDDLCDRDCSAEVYGLEPLRLLAWTGIPAKG